MTLQERIVTEALQWVGTPWHRNAACKGVGADCIGVVAGVAIACDLHAKNGEPFSALYHGAYPQTPNGSLLVGLTTLLERVPNAEPIAGDVLLMTFGPIPHHVALYIGGDIVHAYAQVRRCVRQPFDEVWRARTRCVFRFPGVTP